MDIKELDGVIHCTTIEEYNRILNLLKSQGFRDNGGVNYSYGDKTCLRAASSMTINYCDVHFYKNEGYKIISSYEIIDKINEIQVSPLF